MLQEINQKKSIVFAKEFCWVMKDMTTEGYVYGDLLFSLAEQVEVEVIGLNFKFGPWLC